MDKRKNEEVRRASVTPIGGGGGGLDGPLWVGEARLRGSGNRANLLFVGRVGGEKKKNQG